MMTKTRQKEVDKAIANLIRHTEQGKWAERIELFHEKFFQETADFFEIDEDDLLGTLEQHDLFLPTFSYLFELFATTYRDNETGSLIDDYLKRKGWREADCAKKYLKAMSESEFDLWEAVSVEPGVYIDMRLHGSDMEPVRVYEKSGSQQVKKWDCLACRVIEIEGQHQLTGAVLPFSPEQIPMLRSFFRACTRKALESFKEINQEELCNGSADTIKKMVKDELEEQSPQLLLRFWVGSACLALTESGSRMKLSNSDGDDLQLMKLCYEFDKKDRDEIRKRLNLAEQLVSSEEEPEVWAWLAESPDATPQETYTPMLGHISLTDGRLELHVNSLERAENGKKYMAELLDNQVSEPIAVLENMDLSEPRSAESCSSELPEDFDENEAITTLLDRHYRQVLDEPVPALDDLTPRQCAKEPIHHNMLIQWLKGLENRTQAMQPMPQAYDFRWMWEELGIKYPTV